MADSRLPAPIPGGVADHFWTDAALRESLRARLLHSFHQWGYSDVLPPAFEYAETFDSRANPVLREELYRFVDRDGSLLALRADMTIPVARLVATRLHDAPMPQRFCYAGSIYRYGDTRAGQQREFWQAGVELIGEAAPAADAEILVLALAALRDAGIGQAGIDNAGVGHAGIGDIRLAVGHLGFFDALMAELSLSASGKDALFEAVDGRSDGALHKFLQGTNLTAEQRAVVAALPSLSGTDYDEILDRAQSLCLSDAMRTAIDAMRAILAHVSFYGDDGARSLYVDLSEIHNLGYYTGLTFEALTVGLGYPIASGGRYDSLIGTFGSGQPAVGLAINLDRILYLQQAAAPRSASGPLPAHVLVGGEADAAFHSAVAALRAALPELRVAADLAHRLDLSDFTAFAARVMPWLALWFDGECFVLSEGSQFQAQSGRLTISEVIELARTHMTSHAQRTAMTPEADGSR